MVPLKFIEKANFGIGGFLVAAGAGGGVLPENVLLKDALGNASLAGIFSAKEVVAGAFSVKNADPESKTTGNGTIASGDSDKKISTKAVSANAKIFATFESDPGARFWVEKEKDSDGAFTGFTVKLSAPAGEDATFSWWIVEEK